jgi:hypothetical protein
MRQGFRASGRPRALSFASRDSASSTKRPRSCLRSCFGAGGYGASAEQSDAMSVSKFFSLDLTGTELVCICYADRPSNAKPSLCDSQADEEDEIGPRDGFVSRSRGRRGRRKGPWLVSGDEKLCSRVGRGRAKSRARLNGVGCRRGSGGAGDFGGGLNEPAAKACHFRCGIGSISIERGNSFHATSHGLPCQPSVGSSCPSM